MQAKACSKRWRSLRPHCCRQPSRYCKNWRKRPEPAATHVTNLAGKAFQTLNETNWFRRDCREYQDELDWEMRTFRRACRPRCGGRLGCKRTESNISISRPQELWAESCRPMRADRERRAVRRPVAAVGTAWMSSRPSTRLRGGWSTRSPSSWTGGPLCRWPTSLGQAGWSDPGIVRKGLVACALPRPTGAEEPVTSAWHDCTSERPPASREAGGPSSLGVPVHRW